MNQNHSQSDSMFVLARKAVVAQPLLSACIFVVGLLCHAWVLAWGWWVASSLVVFLPMAVVVMGAAVFDACRAAPLRRNAVLASLVVASALGIVCSVVFAAVWHVLTLPLFSTIGTVGLFGAAWVASRANLTRYLGKIQDGVGAMCATCGYDMRGHEEHSVCPECGSIKRYQFTGGEAKE